MSYHNPYKKPEGTLNIAEIRKYFEEQGNSLSKYKLIDTKGPSRIQFNLQNPPTKPLNILAKMNENREDKENDARYATPEIARSKTHGTNVLPTPLRSVNTSQWKTSISDESVVLEEHDSWSNVGDTTFERAEKACDQSYFGKEKHVDEEDEALERLLQEFAINEEPSRHNDETQLQDIEEPSGLWDQSIANTKMSPMKMVGLMRPSTIIEEDTMDSESQMNATDFNSAKASEPSLLTEYLSQKDGSDYGSIKSTEYESVNKNGSEEDEELNDIEAHDIDEMANNVSQFTNDSLEENNDPLEDYEPDSLINIENVSLGGILNKSCARNSSFATAKTEIDEHDSLIVEKSSRLSKSHSKNYSFATAKNNSIATDIQIEQESSKSDDVKDAIDTFAEDSTMSPKRSHVHASLNESQKTPIQQVSLNDSIEPNSEQTTSSDNFMTADEDADSKPNTTTRTENFLTADESNMSTRSSRSVSTDVFTRKKHQFYNKQFMDSISADTSSSSCLNTSNKLPKGKKVRLSSVSAPQDNEDDAQCWEITANTNAEESEVIEIMDDSIAGTLDGVESLTSDCPKDSVLDDTLDESFAGAHITEKITNASNSSMEFNDSLERMEYMMEKGARIMIERGQNVAFHQSVLADMKRTPNSIASPKTPNTVIAAKRCNNSPYNFRSIDKSNANSPRMSSAVSSPKVVRSLTYRDSPNASLNNSIEQNKTPAKLVSQNTFVVTKPSTKSPCVRAAASPRTPKEFQQKNLNSPQGFTRECKTVEFKKPTKIPLPRSVQQLKRPTPFDNVVSPIGEYIKRTPQLPLATNTKSCRNDLFGQMKDWELDITVDEPSAALPDSYVPLLPRKGFISAENRQILDQRKTPIIPGGNKVHRLIDQKMPTVVRHEGRLHTPNNKDKRRPQEMDESFGELSMLAGDISLQVVRSVHRN